MQADLNSLATILVPQPDPVHAAAVMQFIAAEDPERQLSNWCEQLWRNRDQLPHSDPAVIGGLLHAIHVSVLRSGAAATAIRAVNPTLLYGIDAFLPPAAPNRHLLLHLLTLARAADHLQILAKVLVDRPPPRWLEVGQVLSPLMQYTDWNPSDFFPQVLPALQHPSVASPLLDIANFATRENLADVHPATDRSDALLNLLAGVIAKLEKFELQPESFGDDVDTVQALLGEATALAVSLCDALGLIGDERALGRLHQAMQLRHRRVQSEAAGALARLGDQEGKDHLVALAAEPSARLRVLRYAEELDLEGRIDPQYRSEQATAEAELALWLCQPQNMGVPPTSMELIDQRRQSWPGYHSPVDCFLIRFDYDLGQRRYSNIGIAGPVVHAFVANMADLPVDDIYAMYAGWQAEHPEIFSVAATHWNATQKRLATSLQAHLTRLGYQGLSPELLCFLLDEQALACRGQMDATEVIVITDGLETVSLPTAGRLQPPGAQDIWHLYKGRKMLRTFNPNDSLGFH